ncbi:MAG TPA: hypothetical protein VKM55_13455 [Candidatus Lokiarchaeia archaeon]|nr:hypothetical protein [Candidatus Lokiarchaeia archaeon]
MIKSIYIFNKTGNLLFNHDVVEHQLNPMLVGAFLSAIESWAELYSQSGLALFLTGSMKIIFDQKPEYAPELIFCIAAGKDHDETDLHEKMELLLENFMHYFWQDRAAMERGIIPAEKIEDFRTIVQGLLEHQE